MSDVIEKYSEVVDELAVILTTIPKRGEKQSAKRGKKAPPRRKKAKLVAPPPPPPPPQRPPQLQHAVDAKLMTFDELAGKIGHAPHADKLGGKWKMSKRYKVLQREVADSQRGITDLEATPAADLQTDRAAIERELTDQIDAMIAAANSYKDKKKSQSKKRAAQDLVDTANQYKADLKNNLDKVLADPKFADVAAHCTVGELVAAKVRGLNFKDCKFDVHNDDKLDDVNSRDGFGSGAVNTVSKLVHEDGVARIFKAEPMDDPKMKKGPRIAGIDPNAPHYGNRNVASRIASDLIGADVMPEASFAIHNDEVGLMMGMAKGKSPRVKEMSKAADQKWAADNAKFPDEKKRLGLELRDDGWYRELEVMKKPWTAPPSSEAQAKMQEQLNALEWTDMLTGQVDRHSANYFIDVQGNDAKVTGIDNDFCFGKNQGGLLQYDPNNGVTSAGAPVLIDRKTYDRLVAMDGTFDRDVMPQLQGLLTNEEIDASRQRFTAVIGLARQLETAGMVVDDWNAWRSPDTDQTAAQYLKDAPGKNLFKRDLAGFFEEDGLL